MSGSPAVSVRRVSASLGHMIQVASWYFGFLFVAGLLFISAFAGCLRLMNLGAVGGGYARLVRGGSIGVGVALLALAGLLVGGYELDSVWLGDMLQNGLVAVALFGACGCGIAAYSPRGLKRDGRSQGAL
jgi:hypothetical protein